MDAQKYMISFNTFDSLFNETILQKDYCSSFFWVYGSKYIPVDIKVKSVSSKMK